MTEAETSVLKDLITRTTGGAEPWSFRERALQRHIMGEGKSLFVVKQANPADVRLICDIKQHMADLLRELASRNEQIQEARRTANANAEMAEGLRTLAEQGVVEEQTATAIVVVRKMTFWERMSALFRGELRVRVIVPYRGRAAFGPTTVHFSPAWQQDKALRPAITEGPK